MKILIAFDGSGFSHNALRDLQLSGLPDNVEVRIISVSEIFLSPNLERFGCDLILDNDLIEYVRQHAEQIKRDLKETGQILSEAADELRKYFPLWQISVEVASGSPAREILLFAEHFQPELIVLGEQGLSWDNTRRLGSIAEKILTQAACSVRVAKSKNEPSEESMKIAVCFDGSPGSLAAVRAAASRHWRERIEARLMIVTDLMIALLPGRVFQVIPGLPEGKMAGETKYVKLLADEPLEILRGAGISAELGILSGNPRIVLVNEAKDWGANLIYIGANSEASKHKSLGAVARAVAARAHCTVEVVRTN